jgi:predicted O-linked N-acetylglucosamine transferase (SPINDLY family)
LRSEPKQPDALALLGFVSVATGDDAAAAESFAKAISASPRRWDLYYNAGVVLERLARYDEALLRLRKAVELNPNSAQAHAHLASVLQLQGNVDDAIASYRQALAIDENLAPAWYGLAHAQLGRREHIDAIAGFRRAVELDQQLAIAWFGLGCAQIALSEYAAAAESFSRLVALEPENAEAHQNLGQSLFNLGQVDPGIDHFRSAARLAESRPDAARLIELALRSIAVAIPGSPKSDHQAVLDARRAWGARHQIKLPPDGTFDRRGDRRPLRIGYVSAFFGRDNWMKPVWALINQHDRSEVQIHLFSDGEIPTTSGGAAHGTVHAYRRHETDRVHEISQLDNDAVAALVRDQQIDIVVDLNGYSRMDRLPLFARRPAPVSVGWFNMYATTGVDWFDYLIGDEHVIELPEEPFYSEKIIRVPGSYLTFSVDYPVPEVTPPPCLSSGAITFGCLASQYKLTDEVLDAWCAILAACRTARLVLKNTALGRESNREYMCRAFASRGIEPARIELDGPAEHFAFLQKYAEIDIALDPFPYNGGTTTTEAIWQGVPVLTFYGDRWASRTSATILREGGLRSWVAPHVAGYIQLAIDWATATDAPLRLAELRTTMRDHLRQSSVCATEPFARAMESIYRDLWRRKYY